MEFSLRCKAEIECLEVLYVWDCVWASINRLKRGNSSFPFIKKRQSNEGSIISSGKSGSKKQINEGNSSVDFGLG